MDAREKLELIKRNTQEIVTEEELVSLLKTKKNPVVYCGYEPSGPVHLGHFVTITKLMDFEKAGFKVKVLIADIHALLNRKGEEAMIRKEVLAWKKTFESVGLKAEIKLGSDFEFDEDYTRDVMNMAQETTMNRGLRSMQEVARDFENATISQIWYPLMQIEDIKKLNVDVAYGGMEQRKIHMLGRELSGITKHKFIAVHTPLITSLKGPEKKQIVLDEVFDVGEEKRIDDKTLKLERIDNPAARKIRIPGVLESSSIMFGKTITEEKTAFFNFHGKIFDIKKGEILSLDNNHNIECTNIGKTASVQITNIVRQKMSKSIPGTFITVTDTDEQIKETIAAAYCPLPDVLGMLDGNPILQISKLIIFPRIKEFRIKTKFDGILRIQTYEELEKLYIERKIHPLDLKNAVSENLIKIITPIRKLFNK